MALETLRREHDVLKASYRKEVHERVTAENERLAHLRYFEHMDALDRAIHGAADLEQMMSDALGAVLSIFGCDRVWLLYPCDPDALSFRVPMEVTRPEYPGAKVLNVDVLLSAAEARTMREALESETPVTYTVGTDRPISTAEKFAVMSQMFVPLYPKVGKPFVFGMHQCSYARLWTASEQRMFQEIGRRMADALTSLLTVRDLRESEEALRRLNAELERRVGVRTAQLQAANGELEAFAYSVSHDLRAPLRHINGFMAILQERIGSTLDEEGQRNVGTILRATRHMDALIEDLLAFSRAGRQGAPSTEVDVGALVRDVIDELAPESADRLVEWKVGDLPTVTADRSLLRMVLVNLLANALKFTRTRGRAEIEIGSLSGLGDEAVIFVRDNGVGFDAQYAHKLFGVFQRLHPASDFEGTGIGLAIVQRIIGRHGGRTWAEAAVDQGATFFFSIPAGRPRAP